ncbi:hypothetical protein MFLAVUS_006271 [Mucor flavus]|uniref:Uncharacterized protein n=1 Tax=Mucor flavus TaxID=439312 RepID=A0ABP9Z145_9FUNG
MITNRFLTSHESLIDNSSDDNFQPIVLPKLRKRTSDENICRRKKRNKGKEKDTSSASTVSGSAAVSGLAAIPSSSAVSVSGSASGSASGSTAVSGSAAASGSSSVHATKSTNCRSKCSRHFRRLNKQNQPLIVTKALTALSEVESASINSKKFIEYIKKRASVKDILYEYYGNETIKSEKIFFPDSTFGFRIDKKCNIIRGFYLQPEHYCTDSPLGYEVFISYLRVMLQQKYVLERLKKTEIRKLEELADMDIQTDNKDHINTILQKLQLLPFRKLKFSSKLFYDQNDQKLMKKLKDKFGPDPILILGDCSAPNNKHHEPTRNKGLVKILEKNGFKLYLINEFRTSSCCPICLHKLEKFKSIVNPRPHKRLNMPTVTCHELLRSESRLWNRDLAAVLNLLKILNHLRNTGERPTQFKRTK